MTESKETEEEHKGEGLNQFCIHIKRKKCSQRVKEKESGYETTIEA